MTCLERVCGSIFQRVVLGGIPGAYTKLTSCRVVTGIWLHVRPSKRRPPAFEVNPPHCLKKNGTPARTHWSRTPRTQLGSTARKRGPLSPPTITQSIPFSGSREIGPSKGSTDRSEEHTSEL